MGNVGICLIPLIISVLFFLMGYWMKKRQEKREVDYYEKVEAKIIKVDVDTDGSGAGKGKTYTGLLCYTVKEKEYIMQTDPRQERLTVGSKIIVFYKPDNPEQGILTKGKRNHVQTICLCLGTVFLISFVFVVMIFLT